MVVIRCEAERGAERGGSDLSSASPDPLKASRTVRTGGDTGVYCVR